MKSLTPKIQLDLFPADEQPVDKLMALGKQHYSELNYEKALEYFKGAAEQGNPIAQFFVGQIYDDGQGVLQDYEQAVYWYTKAAEQSDASAQWRLGTMYRDGEGVAVDNKISSYWFKKARAQKDTGDRYQYYKGGRKPTPKKEKETDIIKVAENQPLRKKRKTGVSFETVALIAVVATVALIALIVLLAE